MKSRTMFSSIYNRLSVPGHDPKEIVTQPYYEGLVIGHLQRWSVPKEPAVNHIFLQYKDYAGNYHHAIHYPITTRDLADPKSVVCCGFTATRSEVEVFMNNKCNGPKQLTLLDLNPVLETITDPTSPYLDVLQGIVHVDKTSTQLLDLITGLRRIKPGSRIKLLVNDPGVWLYDYVELFNPLEIYRDWMPIPEHLTDRYGMPLRDYIREVDPNRNPLHLY